MKRFVMRRLVSVLCASGILGLSTQAMASAFQLWEQDGASVGNYHAGYAAQASDASIAWYNPAGITRIKHHELVLAGNSIMTDFKYVGTVDVNLLDVGPKPITAQGGNYSLVPALHYVAPINDKIGVGLSIDVPFGLKTDYGRSTILRYAATLTSVNVVDISPSVGFQVTDKASVGVGFDIQKMNAELDEIGTVFSTDYDTESTNRANDTGYGFHAGVLYQFTPNARLGLSYHSQVVHHLSGSSKFIGPVADLLNGGPLETSRSTVNMTLPAYTALSFYDRIHPQVAVMASAIYTQWNIFRNLILNNVAGVVEGEPSTNIVVVMPEYYRNTWNFSVGADYYVTDKITLKGAIGYDETPVQNAYRNVQLPDNNRYVIALGGHYQASKAVGLDLGWIHLFISQARVNPPPQVTGSQIVTTNGNVTGGADVIGTQLTWDIV